MSADDLTAAAGATIVVASLFLAFLIWAFRPVAVSPAARALFHLAFALLGVRAYVVGRTETEPEWWSAGVWTLMAAAAVGMVVAVVAAIDRQGRDTRRKDGGS